MIEYDTNVMLVTTVLDFQLVRNIASIKRNSCFGFRISCTHPEDSLKYLALLPVTSISLTALDL
jgi:hypothetical protein